MPKLTAEQLVAWAETQKVGRPRSEGYGDNKALCHVEDIITLIEAGANIIRTNSKSGLVYYTDVMYEGYRFTCVDKKPIGRLNM